MFFLELGLYLWDDRSDATRLDEIQCLVRSLNMLDQTIFEEQYPFFDYITRDPPVVETNKKQGKPVPHPSLALVMDQSQSMSLIEQHMSSPDRGEDSVNEILIIPLKSNATLQRGNHVPLFPMPIKTTTSDQHSLSYFLLFLGSVIESDDAQKLSKNHRSLYEYAVARGGKRYSYDTVTNDVRGRSAWEEHYGDVTWHRLCVAKRQYDPWNMLGSGLHMWED